jgi:hypothetical protein
MSQSTTLILLPQTYYSTTGTSVIGEKVPAASYYLGASNLQTLTWNFTAVTANVSIQASLSEDPATSDWFEVLAIPGATLTENSFDNLSGNFVWLRAVVSNFTTGVIQYIKVSY